MVSGDGREGDGIDVRLMPYQPYWVDQFAEESARLCGVFGPARIALEHFGSTAVPGMMAKPVIDMLAVVDWSQLGAGWIEELIQVGYEDSGEWGIPGRRLFRKGGEKRTHHLHVYPVGHGEIRRHLVLRDFLSSHPHEVRAYSAFKQGLASQYTDTRDYSPAKKLYVQSLEKRALAWKERGERD